MKRFGTLEIELAASILYYDLEEIQHLFQVVDAISQSDFSRIDGTFLTFVDYLRKTNEAVFKIEDPEERKRKIIESIECLNEHVPNKDNREKFQMWLESVQDKEVPMELADDILAHFTWEEYKKSIAAVDAADIPFADKLAVRPKEIRVRDSDIVRFSDIPIPEDEVQESFTTGLSDLDKLFQPKPTNFVSIAARPGVGKSLFMFNMSINNALQNIPCLYVSLEMSGSQMDERLVNYLTQSNLKDESKDEMGVLIQSDYNKAFAAAKRLPEYATVNKYMAFLKPETFSADFILDRIKTLVKRDGYKIVFIDYLQLLRYNGMDEWASLRQITKDLKNLAFTNNILIVAGSQVNRSSTEMGLTLSDLYGSSTIEADCDSIIGLENPREIRQNNTTILRVKILKQRMGATGQLEYTINYSTGHMLYGNS